MDGKDCNQYDRHFHSVDTTATDNYIHEMAKKKNQQIPYNDTMVSVRVTVIVFNATSSIQLHHSPFS